MQVTVQRVPVGSLVVGIDLVPIAPIRGAAAIQQDITKPECKGKIKRLMSEKGCTAFDLVLHDGSPNVGGAWAQEATSQNALVIDSVKLATELLAPKGTFITKVLILIFLSLLDCLSFGLVMEILYIYIYMYVFLLNQNEILKLFDQLFT